MGKPRSRWGALQGSPNPPRTRSRWRLSREQGGAAPDERPGAAPRSLPQFRPPPSLASIREATHVPYMQSQTKTQIVGFMELQVGSLAVQVPIRTAEPGPALPLASFEVEGERYAILIRGDSSSKAVERAMGEAAKQAVQHLSRKLLN